MEVTSTVQWYLDLHAPQVTSYSRYNTKGPPRLTSFTSTYNFGPRALMAGSVCRGKEGRTSVQPERGQGGNHAPYLASPCFLLTAPASSSPAANISFPFCKEMPGIGWGFQPPLLSLFGLSNMFTPRQRCVQLLFDCMTAEMDKSPQSNKDYQQCTEEK